MPMQRIQVGITEHGNPPSGSVLVGGVNRGTFFYIEGEGGGHAVLKRVAEAEGVNPSSKEFTDGAAQIMCSGLPQNNQAYRAAMTSKGGGMR
jgi:hypothetical protein